MFLCVAEDIMFLSYNLLSIMQYSETQKRKLFFKKSNRCMKQQLTHVNTDTGVFDLLLHCFRTMSRFTYMIFMYI